MGYLSTRSATAFSEGSWRLSTRKANAGLTLCSMLSVRAWGRRSMTRWARRRPRSRSSTKNARAASMAAVDRPKTDGHREAIFGRSVAGPRPSRSRALTSRTFSGAISRTLGHRSTADIDVSHLFFFFPFPDPDGDRWCFGAKRVSRMSRRNFRVAVLTARSAGWRRKTLVTRSFLVASGYRRRSRSTFAWTYLDRAILGSTWKARPSCFFDGKISRSVSAAGSRDSSIDDDNRTGCLRTHSPRAAVETP
mmetsp:Transcript_6756/g.21753  ORF Transcript_6756/g.21753 Transcript_6756/m.21753 type:complete len:250 (+) Transcript_6756:411-1160(+)